MRPKWRPRGPKIEDDKRNDFCLIFDRCFDSVLSVSGAVLDPKTAVFSIRFSYMFLLRFLIDVGPI